MPNTQIPNVQTRSRGVVLLPWLLVLLLAVSNLGTLINARVHAIGFQALERVLSVVGPAVAEHVLSRSTVRVAERQARLARGIAARSAARLTTHAARSVTTIPERLAPVIGTAAVVAFAIYDVQTDCATASDMNEILAALNQQQIDAGSLCRLADKIPSPSKAWSVVKESAGGIKQKATDRIDRLSGAPK
jgi:hypothetical protein